EHDGVFGSLESQCLLVLLADLGGVIGEEEPRDAHHHRHVLVLQRLQELERPVLHDLDEGELREMRKARNAVREMECADFGGCFDRHRKKSINDGWMLRAKAPRVASYATCWSWSC